MRTDQRGLRRAGLAVATAALVAAGVIGSVSVAGARETKTIYSVFNNNVNPCFSTESKATCNGAEKPTITIQTGDTVVWEMSSGGVHNAAPKSSTPADPVWDGRSKVTFPQSDTYTFGKPGTYEFVCSAHAPYMTGTIVVEGEPVATATPTATPEVTATPTFAATVPPAATAVPDDHTTTPLPGKGKAAPDKTAPTLTATKVARDRAGAKLSFTVSEASTIQVVAYRKGSKKALTRATLHVAAGKRSVVVRSSSLRKKGTYTLQWQAVDAMSNRSVVVKKTLKVKR
jgi:plastocyanin